MKSEARSPKPERSPKSELPNPPPSPRSDSPSDQAILGFRVSAFFRPSGFGFRPWTGLTEFRPPLALRSRRILLLVSGLLLPFAGAGLPGQVLSLRLACPLAWLLDRRRIAAAKTE